jgi:hypothetical protein
MGRPSKLEQLAALASALLIVWQTLPDHQRTAIKMRALLLAERVAGHLARHIGRTGMSDELAGREGDARREYTVAFKLSLARDKVSAALRQMSP